MELEELKQLLSSSWKEETCSPGLRSEWNEENPSLGQCAITALIVNDILGGKIMRCMSSSGSHYYNLIDDELIDLTVEQFKGEIPDYVNSEERTREYLLSNEDTKNRYRILLGELRHNLVDKDFEEIANDENLNKYKKYLNRFYMFSTFEIIKYNVDENFEYVKLSLSGQNTGLVIDIKHNLKNDKYEYHENIHLPQKFIRFVFNLGREYKDNLALEEKLASAYSRSYSRT